MEEDIEELKRYIQVDRNMRDNSTVSDFDKFCENHCQAIENILNKLEELEKENKELKNFIELEYEVCGGRTMYFKLMSLPKGQLVKTMLRARKNCMKCSIRKTLDEYVTDSIPKSKIEDKIKELERERKILKRQHIDLIKVYTPLDIVQAEILRLKELLEEK